jgi:CheY-like chemotaxis protein
LLSTRAGLAACGKIAQLSGAVEAMLYEQLARSNGAISQSSIQTLAQAVDCLGGLFNTGSTGSFDFTSKASVLLVDDDRICNMANEVALKRANYDAVAASSGTAALDLLNENEFDLILLDIDMPEMGGIQVCERLRLIPRHQNTPVIFVTVLSDFENRAKALMGGGNDLISKPISPLELIVKATIFLLTTAKPRKQSQPTKAAASPPSEAAAPAAAAHISRPEGHGTSEHAFQAVTEKLKYLRQALAEETQQREAVEQQAAENAKRRAELETAIEENQRSQQWFRQLLEESQHEETEQGGKPNLTALQQSPPPPREIRFSALFGFLVLRFLQ